MVDAAYLEGLLAGGESDRVEFKESPTGGRDLREVVCALANDLAGTGEPGYLLVGVDDRGSPTGLAVDHRLLEQLGQMRSGGQIQPIPVMDVRVVEIRGSQVAVVRVQPSVAPPVRYKGRTCVRHGPMQSYATPEEERRLSERATAGTLPFDWQPCRAATLDDLDLPSFEAFLRRAVDPDVLRENQRTTVDRLASFRCYDVRVACPTTVGILAFGRDPIRFLPGAYVQFVRFGGDRFDDPIEDQREIRGRMGDILDELADVLGRQIRRGRAPAGPMKHEEKFDYPVSALREFTANAVLHRTYDSSHAPVRISWFNDRVVIQSPGGLYGRVRPDNYERVTDYRNPGLAEILKGLGFVERFGVGIQRARRALKENGNPDATFEFDPHFVEVTVPSALGPVSESAKKRRPPKDEPPVDWGADSVRDGGDGEDEA